MGHVRWDRRPVLRQPILVAAFEGWNDAGDASTTAVRYLRDRWEAVPFATVDAEEFFDFTEVRPRVELSEGEQRAITWPSTELSAATVPGADVDVIFLVGTEPQLRWRTFCEQITSVAAGYGASLVVTLGALLSEVPHSRPTTVIGSTSQPELMDDLDMETSCYEGPTGIIGVLHDAAMTAGFTAASLWAEVPTYVPGAPSPKAALALVERVTGLVKGDVHTTDLEIMAASYERQINELVAADEDTTRYVERLEVEADGRLHPSGDGPDAGLLVEELERYLRNRHPGG